ncbi:hypothetical protein M885DRAFT_591954 [Pelagophyceae sp. CCMP2097]|nr:hypothetical protein M885DRAFT_591954 [Pelagophyceae sp. CCMP2097]
MDRLFKGRLAQKQRRGAGGGEAAAVPVPYSATLLDRCALVLGDELAGAAGDVLDWGADINGWPGPALDRCVGALPQTTRLRLRHAFPAGQLARVLTDDVLGAPGRSGADVADVFAGDAAGQRWRVSDPRFDAAQVIFQQPESQAGAPACEPTLEAFKHSFDVFTSQLLRGLDLKALGVVAAGGAVLACLEPKSFEEKRTTRQVVDWYAARHYASEPCRGHDATFREERKKGACSAFAASSDVDLFFVGVSSEEAMHALREIHTTVVENACSSVAIVRSASALTFVVGFPKRHVQVVLRLYASAADVLESFDVDACCFAYDGSNVQGSFRGLRALTERVNRVDASRRSLTYESRLVKYALRGYAVHVPPALYRPNAVDPRIFDLPLAFGSWLAQPEADWSLSTAAASDDGVAQLKRSTGLVRLLQASRIYALRTAADRAAAALSAKKAVDLAAGRRKKKAPKAADAASSVKALAPKRESLRDVALRTWSWSRVSAPPLLPDEPRTFYNAQGPTNCEDDFVAQDEAAETAGVPAPLYSQALPWRPGWDAWRVLHMVRNRERRNELADEEGPHGEDDWRPPRVTLVAPRSNTLPSEAVVRAGLELDDLMHHSALRAHSSARSFYPVSIQGFSDSAHLLDARNERFFTATVLASPAPQGGDQPSRAVIALVDELTGKAKPAPPPPAPPAPAPPPPPSDYAAAVAAAAAAAAAAPDPAFMAAAAAFVADFGASPATAAALAAAATAAAAPGPAAAANVAAADKADKAAKKARATASTAKYQREAHTTSEIQNLLRAKFEDWVTLGLLPKGRCGLQAAAFAAGVVVRTALTQHDVDVLGAADRALRALAGSAALLERLAGLLDFEPPAVGATLDFDGAVPQTFLDAVLLKAHLEGLQDTATRAVRSVVQSRCTKMLVRCAGLPKAFPDLRERHGVVLKADPAFSEKESWSEAARALSDRCGVRVLRELGRRVVAQRCLRPWLEAYLEFEIEFEGYAVSADECRGACGRCAALLTATRKCARCKKVAYCSRECQAADWECHKSHCVTTPAAATT